MPQAGSVRDCYHVRHDFSVSSGTVISATDRRSATLAMKANAAAQCDGRHLGHVAVGKLHIDGSREEDLICKDLYTLLESNRKEISYWLWPMGDAFLADTIPIIKDAADLKTFWQLYT
jgi:hypothetical protein